MSVDICPMSNNFTILPHPMDDARYKGVESRTGARKEGDSNTSRRKWTERICMQRAYRLYSVDLGIKDHTAH